LGILDEITVNDRSKRENEANKTHRKKQRTTVKRWDVPANKQKTRQLHGFSAVFSAADWVDRISRCLFVAQRGVSSISDAL